MPTAASADQPPDADLILDVQSVTLRFGGVVSLADVSLRALRGEILSVIGPNGAGKTSLFNCLTGVYEPQAGSILFSPARGRAASLVGLSPHRISALGIARTFQTARLFAGLNVFDNVLIGVESKSHAGPIGAILRLPKVTREEAAAKDRTAELLELTGLSRRSSDLAASLAYGDRRRLEIARALGTQPEVLLLDEPAAGTNPTEKRGLSELIQRINTTLGVTVLLIEHDMGLVMSTAHRLYVLNFGRVIAEGTPREVQENPLVTEAYLGTTATKGST